MLWWMGVEALGDREPLCSSERSIEADSYYCPCNCDSIKTLCCITTGGFRYVHGRHDVSALALSSGRVRFPGFITWRYRIRFRSPHESAGPGVSAGIMMLS